MCISVRVLETDTPPWTPVSNDLQLQLKLASELIRKYRVQVRVLVNDIFSIFLHILWY